MNRRGRRMRQRGVQGDSIEPRSDEALLARVAGGDAGALRELYDRHAPWLLLRLARRCGDRGIVEDAVQTDCC